VFVFSIAKNQIYSHWRAKSRRRPEEDVGALSLEALGPTPSRVMRELEAHQQLNAGLRSIPLDDQILLESYYWQRLSGPELAGMMGLTEPAVRSRLRRALERLRNAVETMTAHQDTAATLESLDAWSAELRALERVGSAKAPA
jgi:RNA polymerase sigma-70 factor (ECF subfamily)